PRNRSPKRQRRVSRRRRKENRSPPGCVGLRRRLIVTSADMSGMRQEAIAEDPEAPDRRSNLKAITVIGILAALVVAILVWLGVRFLLRAVEKGTWVKTQTEMGEIQQALNKYAVAHGGSYPATLSDLVPTFGGPLPTDPYTG